jgi:nucleotide-binding universal stress UspA family protein
MPDRDAVVVGIDPGHDNSSTLEWAAADARSRHAPLWIVCAHHTRGGALYLGTYGASVSNERDHDTRQAAEQSVALAVEDTARRNPDLDVRGDCMDGRPVDTLLELSRNAPLVVLGTRGRSALESVLLGSVSSAVSARAHGPVVVVRRVLPEAGTHPRVVVGVDASRHAETVLGFAFDHASRHTMPLRAILCWRNDAYDMDWQELQTPLSERAERWLAEAMAGWQEKYPQVPVATSVERVNPVSSLVAAGHAGGLVVVGARSAHRAALSSMLGSVSQGVLHHAPCPVAIVDTHDVRETTGG